MKCEINLAWRNADEDMSLTRTKNPDEVWSSPRDGDWRSIQQMIAVLDATYIDARAGLIGMLPKELRDKFTEGK